MKRVDIFQNKRKSPRYIYGEGDRCNAQFFGQFGDSYTARVFDLSPTGAKIILEGFKAVFSGEMVLVALSLPGRYFPKSFQAKIVWIKNAETDDTDDLYLGIKFIKLDQNSKRDLFRVFKSIKAKYGSFPKKSFNSYKTNSKISDWLIIGSIAYALFMMQPTSNKIKIKQAISRGPASISSFKERNKKNNLFEYKNALKKARELLTKYLD